MLFSLVSTIFNEAKRLRQTIADLEAQTIKPAEIIITDAGSSDTSWEILTEWQQQSAVPIVLLKEEGCNVARGRNLAIKAAKYDLIVSTDFGCRFENSWLEKLLSHFSTDERLEVVGGAYGVNLERLTTLPARAEYILQNGYCIPLDKRFIVTSRSIAYKKYVWQKIGGYPEWLSLAGDDSTFWKLILEHGFKHTLSEHVGVYWERHQTLNQYKQEAFRYGKGDGESGINIRNTFSHILETTLRYFGFPLAAIALFTFQKWFLVPFLCISLLGFRSHYKAFRNWWRIKSPTLNLVTLSYSFLMIEHLRFAYLKGYYLGTYKSTPLQKTNKNQQKLTLKIYAG